MTEAKRKCRSESVKTKWKDYKGDEKCDCGKNATKTLMFNSAGGLNDLFACKKCVGK